MSKTNIQRGSAGKSRLKHRCSQLKWKMLTNVVISFTQRDKACFAPSLCPLSRSLCLLSHPKPSSEQTVPHTTIFPPSLCPGQGQAESTAITEWTKAAGSEQTRPPPLLYSHMAFHFLWHADSYETAQCCSWTSSQGLQNFIKPASSPDVSLLGAFLDSCTLRDFGHHLLNYIITSQLTKILFWWDSAQNLTFVCTALSKRGLGRLKALLIPLPTTLCFLWCPAARTPLAAFHLQRWINITADLVSKRRSKTTQKSWPHLLKFSLLQY